MNDSYSQDHSGSGDNIMNFGPRQLEFSAELVDRLSGAIADLRHRPISIHAHGPERSLAIAQRIQEGLRARGFNVEDQVQRTFGLIPPLERPIEIDPREQRPDLSVIIWVDAGVPLPPPPTQNGERG